MLAQKLGMEQIAAEKWIVKMVSDAQLNAKIDSQSGHVILGVQPPDVYQQVIEIAADGFVWLPLASDCFCRPYQYTISAGHRDCL